MRDSKKTARKWVGRNCLFSLYKKRSVKYNKANSRPFADKVVKASSLRDISLALQGVDYAIIGGHAVAIHGYPRTTQDIDLLVSPSSLQEAEGRLGKPGTPLAIGGSSVEWNGIDVDLVCPDQPWVNDLLAGKQQSPYGPVVSKPGLVLMKLWSSRGGAEDMDMMQVIKHMTPQDTKTLKALVAKWLPNDVEDVKNLINYSKYV